MTKGNKVWGIAIALLGAGALLESQFHKSPVRVALDSGAESLNTTVAPAGHAQSSKGQLPVGGTVEPSNPEFANINTESLPPTTRNSEPEEHAFDRDFAAAAAKPYVETYQRQHPAIKIGSFDWAHFQAIYATARDGSNAKGYIVVYFPASQSPGSGFTCFKVKDEASDHLEPVTWGYVPDLAHGIENFRRAAESNGCAL